MQERQWGAGTAMKLVCGGTVTEFQMVCERGDAAEAQSLVGVWVCGCAGLVRACGTVWGVVVNAELTHAKARQSTNALNPVYGVWT
jgi:hypothetical protein